jgi:Ni/Co efflux regulator RcnB
MAELRGLKYVKVDDKVLLVQPANGIVRGVIEE